MLQIVATKYVNNICLFNTFNNCNEYQSIDCCHTESIWIDYSH